MSKRKRDLVERGDSTSAFRNDTKQQKSSHWTGHPEAIPVTIQIVVGTYEKILHGIQATVSDQTRRYSRQGPTVEFADTFLLSPHSSAIRCLAISPPSASDATKSQKIILASGSSDQIINLYHLSREAPPQQSKKGPQLPTLAGKKVTENPKNRELGSLQHHGSSINALHFPTRSKLLSAADDNTIAVARTRDWSVLSTVKAPIPKAHGRPSGDTAPLGGTPAGINDFAVHPSMKLMVSVGKGEKCMRLWNLVTGKKAGVLSFERNLLQAVGEGKWATGEGRRVAWNSVGDEFVVGFERGCVVFGMDCKPKCQILPLPRTKIHQLQYTTILPTGHDTCEVLTLSTEDGRILFCPTNLPSHSEGFGPADKAEIPVCKAVGQIGGVAAGFAGRIKDFEILRLPRSRNLLVVTGSSDGAIRLWEIDQADLQARLATQKGSLETGKSSQTNGTAADTENPSEELPSIKQVGSHLGTYEAGNRITCLKAFIMVPSQEPKTNGVKPDQMVGTVKGLDNEIESDLDN